MAADSLRHLADMDEIHIGFRRPDGSAGSTPIWVVGVGEDVYVRSLNGPRGGWYRRLRANPNGEVRDEEHRHEIRADPVTDSGTVEAVTSAYQAKYAGSPYLESFLTDETASATLRLQPR